MLLFGLAVVSWPPSCFFCSSPWLPDAPSGSTVVLKDGRGERETTDLGTSHFETHKERVYLKPALGPQVVPVYPFLGEGSPTKIDHRKRGYPYSNLSTGGPSATPLPACAFRTCQELVNQLAVADQATEFLPGNLRACPSESPARVAAWFPFECVCFFRGWVLLLKITKHGLAANMGYHHKRTHPYKQYLKCQEVYPQPKTRHICRDDQSYTSRPRLSQWPARDSSSILR